MKDKDRTSEREYQDRLESFLKNAFNTQLQPLRSLETATTKRRARRRQAILGSRDRRRRLPANGAPAARLLKDDIGPPSDSPLVWARCSDFVGTRCLL